jgi:hypothetical protein
MNRQYLGIPVKVNADFGGKGKQSRPPSMLTYRLNRTQPKPRVRNAQQLCPRGWPASSVRNPAPQQRTFESPLGLRIYMRIQRW